LARLVASQGVVEVTRLQSRIRVISRSDACRTIRQQRHWGKLIKYYDSFPEDIVVEFQKFSGVDIDAVRSSCAEW